MKHSRSIVATSWSYAARLGAALVVALALVAGQLVAAPPAAQATGVLPTGFTDTAAVDEPMNQPTTFRFAPDGRLVVAEKSGTFRVYDSLADKTSTKTTLLHREVHNNGDRGLLGFDLDPQFPARPYIYAFYAWNHRPGTPANQVPAYLGPQSPEHDECPMSPLGEGECPADGRLVRLTVAANGSVGDPQPILSSGWCFHYSSHATGQVEFGPDGYLYLSAGDGASYEVTDDGSRSNPCGDPAREGGSLRSQDLRTPGDPVSLDGSIIRIDAVTGKAAPDNPLIGSADANARRVIAYGLRNPFRFGFTTLSDGRHALDIADVGRSKFEEVNQLVLGDDSVHNFGWPCYEGGQRQAEFDTANLPICENLYAEGPSAVDAPMYAYAHGQKVAGETCAFNRGSSVSAVEHVPAASGWPGGLVGSLLFGDYTRGCIWAMQEDANGDPDPTTVIPFHQEAWAPVMMQFGPGGDLYYLAIYDPGTWSGSLRRVRYHTGNVPPSARLRAKPTYGPAPLTIQFNASGSTDPEGPVTYAWDLDGDGSFDDSDQPAPTWTYAASANVTVSVRVTDNQLEASVAKVTVSPGNTPPRAQILAPLPTSVVPGQRIDFAGRAIDDEDGAITGTGLTWNVDMRHCPGGCHTHPGPVFTGAGGSFVVQDHDRPARIRLTLSATDSRGLVSTDSVELPLTDRSVPTPTPTATPTPTSTPTPDATPTPTATPQRLGKLVLRSAPRGFVVKVDGKRVRTRAVIRRRVGTRVVLVAPRVQRHAGKRHVFRSWRRLGKPRSRKVRKWKVRVEPGRTVYVLRYRRR